MFLKNTIWAAQESQMQIYAEPSCCTTSQWAPGSLSLWYLHCWWGLFFVFLPPLPSTGVSNCSRIIGDVRVMVTVICGSFTPITITAASSSFRWTLYVSSGATTWNMNYINPLQHTITSWLQYVSNLSHETKEITVKDMVDWHQY